MNDESENDHGGEEDQRRSESRRVRRLARHQLTIEADLIRQQHLPLRIIRNFAERRKYTRQDPRRAAATTAFVFFLVFRVTFAATIAGGGVIAALTYLEFRKQNSLLRQTLNSQIERHARLSVLDAFTPQAVRLADLDLLMGLNPPTVKPIQLGCFQLVKPDIIVPAPVTLVAVGRAASASAQFTALRPSSEIIGGRFTVEQGASLVFQETQHTGHTHVVSKGGTVEFFKCRLDQYAPIIVPPETEFTECLLEGLHKLKFDGNKVTAVGRNMDLFLSNNASSGFFDTFFLDFRPSGGVDKDGALTGSLLIRRRSDVDTTAMYLHDSGHIGIEITEAASVTAPD